MSGYHRQYPDIEVPVNSPAIILIDFLSFSDLFRRQNNSPCGCRDCCSATHVLYAGCGRSTGDIHTMRAGNNPFIVFEGIDGSGKSTIAEMIFRHYESGGIPIFKGAEPSNGKRGKEIRKLLSSGKSIGVKEQLRLFLLDREDDVRNNILPALREGKMVILDRYYHSNAAYQGALDEDPQMIIGINLEQGFPVPDRIYCMDIDADIALKRIQKRAPSGVKDFFEKKNLLQKIRANYLSFAGPDFIVIDSSLPVSKVFETVRNDIDTVFFSS